MDLREFLESRGLTETTTKLLEDEKIDINVILLMSDEELQKFIPAYGDRAALISFCRKKNNVARKSLFEKIKEKLEVKSKKTQPQSRTNSSSSSLAFRKKKDTRKIDIGWMNMSTVPNKLLQVRTKAGGGTRKVSVAKSATGYDILAKAKTLFFPQGVSLLGPLSAFRSELLDYKCHKFNMSMTISEIYDITQLNILRFYLATYNNSDEVDDEEFYIPVSSTSQSSLDDIPISIPRRSQRLLGDNVANYIATFDSEESAEIAQTTNELLTTSVFDIHNDLDNYEIDFQDTGLSFSFEHSGSDKENNMAIADHNLPRLSPFPENQSEDPVEKIVVHRGNVFKELIEIVKVRKPNFTQVAIEMILPNGASEQAEDMGGVLRDCFSEFFTTFYNTCTMGSDLKVPCLRHDFQEEEWSAVGDIICQSYISERYFPIKIAPVFIKYCLDNTIEEEEVLANFLKFVSPSDSALLKKAMESFDEVDNDDLLEFCSTYEAKSVPTKNNITIMLNQIAKEELLQKPSFVKNCFYPYIQKIKDKLNLTDIYSKLEPTDKNIIPLLNTDENLSVEEKQIFNYLKKFIKEGDTKLKESFLRFCTGSDVANQYIKIEFIKSEGIGRAPIAHTCSKMLQIPLSYENFMVFRTEFKELLSSNVWVMDII